MHSLRKKGKSKFKSKAALNHSNISIKNLRKAITVTKKSITVMLFCTV